MSVDDKYTYPGSGGVLVNSKGIREAARLDSALNDYASAAMAELRVEPVPSQLGYEYLRHIHTRMFERIVPGIAGRLRDVNVQAIGTGVAYARPEYIQGSLSQLFDQLGREDYLTGLDAGAFATRLADRWGDLTAIHPYRDGNTRSQSFYVTVLAERAGHPIDWRRIDVDTLRMLRLRAVVGSSRPLADYLAPHLLARDALRQNPSLENRISQRVRELRSLGGSDADPDRGCRSRGIGGR